MEKNKIKSFISHIYQNKEIFRAFESYFEEIKQINLLIDKLNQKKEIFDKFHHHMDEIKINVENICNLIDKKGKYRKLNIVNGLAFMIVNRLLL